MSLPTLPNELLLSIASHIEEQIHVKRTYSGKPQIVVRRIRAQRTLYALSLVNRHFHSLFNSHLYDYNIRSLENRGMGWACEHGSLDTVKKFLDHGADLPLGNRDGGDGAHFVKMAVENGHADIVKLAIQLAPEDSPKQVYENLMKRAIKSNQITVVRVLDQFIDPAQLENYGFEFLCSAAYHLDEGDDTILQFLLDRHFGSSIEDIYLKARNCSTELQDAAVNGGEKCVSFIIDQGVDIDFHCWVTTFTPLIFAIREQKSANALCLLRRGADPYQAGYDEWSPFMPLYLATLLDLPEVVEALLDLGVNIDGTYSDGVFPGFPPSDELIELLNDRDITDDCSSNCCLPLCVASMMGHEDIVKILLDRGADPNHPDPNGDLALGYAADGGHLEIVKMLAEAGAHLNQEDSDGWTALNFAWHRGGVATTLEILEAGVVYNSSCVGGEDDIILMALTYGHASNDKPIMPDNKIRFDIDCMQYRNSWRPPFESEEKGHDCHLLVSCLLDKGSDIEARDFFKRSVLHQAAFQNCEHTVELLLKKGAKLEAKDTFGQTPLHMASGESEQNKTVSLMLQYGANPNSRDRDGDTPLHLASRASALCTVETLLRDQRTDPNLQNANGETAMHLALLDFDPTKQRVYDMTKIVQALYKAGADPNTTDENGKTPLDLAKVNRDKDAFIGSSGQMRVESIVQLLSKQITEIEAGLLEYCYDYSDSDIEYEV